MSFSSPFYCNNCGAANQKQANYCFYCEEPLFAPAKETLIKQRYRLLGSVGQGGFGAVYRAEDTLCGNRLVALKQINFSLLTAEEAIEAADAFNREVLLLSGLEHPNLPCIHDNFTDAGHWYLVLDFIEGETLERYLARMTDGRLPREEVLDIGMQLCTVLDYLHSCEPPIIYRDLKPANVMRTADGHLYLIDFGIARYFKPGQARDTRALGSPGYAAPEQYGRAQTTPRADIYSLGALLHHLLTGKDPALAPFRFVPLHQPNGATADRLQSLLLQMVEIDANQRPASIAAVQQELEQIIAASRPLGSLLCTYRSHNRLVLAVAWSPDGTHIASGSSDGMIHVWNAETGQCTFTYCDPFKWYAWSWSLAWSPDGTYMVSGSDDTSVHVWRVGNTETAAALDHVYTYHGHANWVNAVAWSPDSTRIASGSDDMTVHVWQMRQERWAAKPDQVDIYRGHSRWVEAVAWSPDGNFIASGGNDGTVQVWNAATKDTVLIYRSHIFGVNALAWSPDSIRIASCSWDNTVHVWDVETGNTLFTYRGHDFAVNALAWSPDGTRIASASKDKTVKVWDAAIGNTLFTYRGHSSWVYAVAWSPDGTRIASAGNDKIVQIWQAV